MRIILDMGQSRTIVLSRPSPSEAVRMTVQLNVPGKPFIEAEFALHSRDMVALIRALQAVE